MKWWFVLLCSLVFSVQAETFDAKVIAVLDGDTVLVLRGAQKVKVRPRHGGAEPSGAGEAASHLLPQTAGFASNVSEVRPHLRELLQQDLQAHAIRVADHCYGCTAGQGSSCGGAMATSAAAPGHQALKEQP
ncbi:MAG: DUF3641 domain-containing protein [Sideroxyarcus sp.]|nr:DUF3641 domain-containing protein [Sideroxyarcus sp.]